VVVVEVDVEVEEEVDVEVEVEVDVEVEVVGDEILVEVDAVVVGDEILVEVDAVVVGDEILVEVDVVVVEEDIWIEVEVKAIAEIVDEVDVFAVSVDNAVNAGVLVKTVEVGVGDIDVLVVVNSSVLSVVEISTSPRAVSADDTPLVFSPVLLGTTAVVSSGVWLVIKNLRNYF